MIVYIHENGIEEIEHPMDNTGEYSLGANYILYGNCWRVKCVHMFRDESKCARIFMHPASREPVLNIPKGTVLKAETLMRVLEIMGNFEIFWGHFNEEVAK